MRPVSSGPLSEILITIIVILCAARYDIAAARLLLSLLLCLLLSLLLCLLGSGLLVSCLYRAVAAGVTGLATVAAGDCLYRKVPNLPVASNCFARRGPIMEGEMPYIRESALELCSDQ